MNDMRGYWLISVEKQELSPLYNKDNRQLHFCKIKSADISIKYRLRYPYRLENWPNIKSSTEIYRHIELYRVIVQHYLIVNC